MISNDQEKFATSTFFYINVNFIQLVWSFLAPLSSPLLKPNTTWQILQFRSFSKTDRERMKTLKLPVPWHPLKEILYFRNVKDNFSTIKSSIGQLLVKVVQCPIKVPYFRTKADLGLYQQISSLVYAKKCPSRFSKPQSTSLLEQASTLSPISSVVQTNKIPC